jgi:hypothetical protein
VSKKHKQRPEIYVSIDVESDGPIPGKNSMLSLGAAAFDPRSPDRTKPISTFSANFQLLQGATSDPDTMKWWATQPEAWKECQTNVQHPDKAMHAFVAWLDCLPGKPIAVCYPSGYDFTFVYWYLIAFTGTSPFSFSALDVKTFAMALLGTGFAESSKRNFPPRWFDKSLKHTHRAQDDAHEQGVMFMNALAEREDFMPPYDDVSRDPMRPVTPEWEAELRAWISRRPGKMQSTTRDLLNEIFRLRLKLATLGEKP